MTDREKISCWLVVCGVDYKDAPDAVVLPDTAFVFDPATGELEQVIDRQSKTEPSLRSLYTYGVICKLRAATGRAPLMREIAEQLGIGESGAKTRVGNLRASGYALSRQGSDRSVRLIIP